MLYRISKTGFFLACSDKECKTTQPVDPRASRRLREVSEFKCPVCDREMIKRKGRFGEFLGCSGYSVKNEKGEPCCTHDHQPRQGRQTPSAQRRRSRRASTAKSAAARCSFVAIPSAARGLAARPSRSADQPKLLKKLTGDDLKQVEALLPLLKRKSGQSPRDGRQDRRRNPRRRRQRADESSPPTSTATTAASR